MKILIFILQKEFRQIFRDKTILIMMMAMPIIQLIILPLAANFDVKNINVVFVDHDHSSYSQKLISKIGSSGYFKIAGAKQEYQQGIQLIENSTADVLIEIPTGFERNLVREGKQGINITIDAINGTKSGLASSYLRAIIQDFTRSLDVNIIASEAEMSRSAVIDIQFSNWFNPKGEYTYYMVPAILVLLLTMIGGYMTALNIVKEKEIGTIEQINVTPIKKWQFILGKLLPFWILGMIVFTIGLLVSYLIYHIFPLGSIALLYLFAAVYLIAVLGFGLLISTYSNTQVQAMFLAFFFIMIFILMSGFFTSVDSMPTWARNVSHLTPVTHFMKVVRMIILKGSSFSDVKMELLYEIGFALFLNGWAIFNYRKTS